jgi:hypothetical protein
MCFFSSSTNRWGILQNFLTKKSNLSLKSLSKTRWSARDDACKSLNRDWGQIALALEFIKNDDTQKPITRNEASGYLQQLQRLETALLSIMWGQLLERINISSKTLQSKEITLSTVAEIYDSLYNYVIDFRSKFELLEEKAIEKSKVCEYEDNFKRKKKRMLRNDETREQSETETNLNGREKFKVNTFLVIVDRLLSELSKRKTVYEELSSLFDMFVSGTDWDETAISENAEKLCSKFMDDLPEKESFTNECLHFFSFLKTIDEKHRKSFFDLQKIINDRGLRELYPYVDICLKIFLSMAVSNCSAERSFSVMKRLKSYLRSTMSNNRLNWQAVLTIECDMTKNVNFDDLIDSFAKIQSRRKLL